MTDGALPTASDRLNSDAVPTLMGLARAFRRAGRAPDELMRVFRFAECEFCGGAMVAPGWRPLLRAVCAVGPPCQYLWLSVGKEGRLARNRECLFR